MWSWLLLALAAAEKQFLVMTLPNLRQIAYVALPDPVLRVLVIKDLVAPRSLALDQNLFRLYVSDSAQQKVFWYQISIQGDKLISDGTQHIALESVETNNIAVDGSGNLYFSGKQLVLPPLTPTSGVWRNSAIGLHTGVTNMPSPVWTPGNTGAPAKWSSAAAVATDNLNVYWGNAENAETLGTVVKAPADPPDMNAEASVRMLTHNTATGARAMALTPKFLFYTTADGIYGIAKGKMDDRCDADTCQLVSNALADAEGIAWDGDGTIYVADKGQSKIFSFPSGGLSSHPHLTEIADAPKVHGLIIVQVPDQQAAAPALGMALLLALALS